MQPLTDEERSAIHAKIRADRLARGNRPPPVDIDQVKRSVIWSQYLSGVDARQYLKTREPIVFPEERGESK